MSSGETPPLDEVCLDAIGTLSIQAFVLDKLGFGPDAAAMRAEYWRLVCALKRATEKEGAA